MPAKPEPSTDAPDPVEAAREELKTLLADIEKFPLIRERAAYLQGYLSDKD